MSSNLTNVIFGINYLKTHVLILFLLISIYPISITTIIGKQYLTVTKQEKKFKKYIIVPKYASIDASISTVIIELITLIIKISIIKKLLDLNVL